MSNYIGTYLNPSREGKEGYEITIIRDDGKQCYDREGRIFTYQQLDFDYEKIQSPMYSPEVLKELKSMGGEFFNSSVQTKKPKVDTVVNPTIIHQQKTIKPAEKRNKYPTIETTDISAKHYGSQDLQNFIAIAVKNSRKKGNSSQLDINLTIEFDFDVEKVIGSTAEICESEKDEDIVNEILNYSNLELDTIKKTIVETLLKTE